MYEWKTRRRNKRYKLLRKVGDEAIFNGFNGLLHYAVVTEKTRKAIKRITGLTFGMGNSVNCRLFARRTDSFILTNESNRRCTSETKVLPYLPAPEAPLGKHNV